MSTLKRDTLVSIYTPDGTIFTKDPLKEFKVNGPGFVVGLSVARTLGRLKPF